MLLGRTETLKHDGGLRRTRIEEAHSEHGWVQRQILGQKYIFRRGIVHYCMKTPKLWTDTMSIFCTTPVPKPKRQKQALHHPPINNHDHNQNQNHHSQPSHPAKTALCRIRNGRSRRPRRSKSVAPKRPKPTACRHRLPSADSVGVGLEGQHALLEAAEGSSRPGLQDVRGPLVLIEVFKPRLLPQDDAVDGVDGRLGDERASIGAARPGRRR